MTGYTTRVYGRVYHTGVGGWYTHGCREAGIPQGVQGGYTSGCAGWVYHCFYTFSQEMGALEASFSPLFPLFSLLFPLIPADS